jgi:hypothetical protein
MHQLRSGIPPDAQDGAGIDARRSLIKRVLQAPRSALQPDECVSQTIVECFRLAIAPY